MKRFLPSRKPQRPRPDSRGLIIALSHDEVEKIRILYNLKALSEVRNAIVHNGDTGQQGEAKRLIPAVGEYVM